MGRPEYYRRLQARFLTTLEETEWHSGIFLGRDSRKFSKIRDFILFHIEPGSGRLHTFNALLDFIAHQSPVRIKFSKILINNLFHIKNFPKNYITWYHTHDQNWINGYTWFSSNTRDRKNIFQTRCVKKLIKEVKLKII